MSRFLTLGTMSLFVVAGTACGSGTSSNANRDATTNIIFIQRDADVSVSDAPMGPDTAIIPLALPDAASVDLWRDPSTLFPDCQGTPEQVSNCIINLPTRIGIPVTRPDPMDYSFCRP